MLDAFVLLSQVSPFIYPRADYSGSAVVPTEVMEAWRSLYS